jgi:ABC-type molybdate transport system substrate-binding protein
MKRSSIVLGLLLAVTLAAPSFAASQPRADERASLTVFAAVSLAEPFG